MASNFNGKKTATLAVVALVALASAGSAFYFLNSNQVSADLIDPGMPSIPGEPISQPTTVASQTSGQNINIPPIPSIPNNISDGTINSTSNSSSTTSSSGSSNSGSASQISSLGVDEVGTNTNPTTGSAQSTQGGVDISGLSTATPSSSSNESFNPSGLPSSNNLSNPISASTTSTPNTLYGIVAAIIAIIALVMLLLLAKKWRQPSDQLPPIS